MKHLTFPTASLAALAIIAAAVLAPSSARSAPSPCDGLSGAAAGLCQAYCRALDCPAGHNGKSCASLLKNWQKQTGQTLFPCDAVCCECENGARACSTAKRCLLATQCKIVDRCVDGQCPTACPCESTCVVGGAPGICRPVAGAPDCRCVPEQVPTPTPTPTPECPCGAICTDTAGVVGSCRVTNPSEPNVCRCETSPPTATPTPPPACPCEATCTDASGAVGSCKPVDPDDPTDCRCIAQTPTPACPCGATCTDANGEVGSCRPDVANPDVCTCVPEPPPPTPTPACPCGEACTTTSGNAGTCREVAGANVCECLPNPTPVPCGPDGATGQCGGECPVAGDVCTACVTPPCPAPCQCAPPVG